MMYLNIAESVLKDRNGFWTAKEIAQQPEAWLETAALLAANRGALDAFLKPLHADPRLRIILTGAGTSAFIGECLEPVLTSTLGKRVEAIATTDLVSGPEDYFQADVPTLLVSFGRSGSSPESVAAVALADQCLNQSYHLVITCNASGELYTLCEKRDNCFALALPEQTHDRSFAMTSSFSSMMLAALDAFTPLVREAGAAAQVADAGRFVLETFTGRLEALAGDDFARVVYLGSKGFKGLAREASLKLLELTDGEVVTTYDSPLGFRHGPKTIINDQTLVMMFVSADPYTRQYDLDLLEELRRDGEVGRIVAVTAEACSRVTNGDYMLVEGLEGAKDSLLLFPYIMFAQVYAFYRALRLGNAPDSPSASGTVNRVVKGVTIHDHRGKGEAKPVSKAG
ncbi:SIS domain-containing protein [Pseudokordiimonas caeni]|uniref:SIS domain-containing protein n=1 Tax=Pseudokordiimonas caeni TaxID=2997908 RepID=UPI002810C7CF|nr:SIS domain-containing protein [Pseudokordiimonas caeni]